jgi:AGCS family alanine or glycine:cation symporter
MIPNLIAFVILAPLVRKITKNYIDRKIKKKKVTPMFSFHPEIQKMAEESKNEDIIVSDEK